MTRAALIVLLIAVVSAVGFLLRGAVAVPTTCVEGTVTGRYGVAWGVRVAAEVGERLLAETWTDPNGRYSLEVPADLRFEMRAVPDPYTFLVAEERTLTLRHGERRTVALALKTIPLTTGTIVGAAWPPALALRAVPDNTHARSRGVRATTGGFSFEFWGLEPGAAYQLESESVDWEIEGAVAFRGGDTGILVSVRRILSCNIDVRECPSGDNIAAFTVTCVGPEGEVAATLEGRDGRLRWKAPHPDPASPADARWTVVVSADGYLEERIPRTFGPVWLQRVREPNVTLLVSDTDGKPYQGALAATGVARFGLGSVDGQARKTEPGRYAAVLPPGRWWIVVDPGPGYEAQKCDVTVVGRDELIVEVPPLTGAR